MIELQKEEEGPVERSTKPKKVYRTLEPQLGRIVRVEQDERSWGLLVASGRFLGIKLSAGEIELKIEGFDPIELDPGEESMRFSVLQSDSGKWKKIYESKDWEEGLGL